VAGGSAHVGDWVVPRADCFSISSRSAAENLGYGLPLDCNYILL
jgi:hypothetical protein